MKERKTFIPKGRQSIPNELLQFGRHLVYSEGTKTEPLYIKDIKRSISKKYNCSINEIQVISVNEDAESYNTISLVEFAEKDVKKRIANKEIINHVWIFFDKDDFPINNFILANSKIENKNNSHDINIDGFNYEIDTNISWHSCFSNESFELWLLLYFNYSDSSLNREQYIKKINNVPSLKKINFVYEKNKDYIHTIFSKNGGSIENAIKNSKKLESLNKTNNPSTCVYKFAEYFKSYMNNDV